jgi:hypothetical protein
LNIGYIIYSYLESDLIKHCHVIFIHSLGQPLIVRSTDCEEIQRKFPRKPHVFPIIVTSLDSTDNLAHMASSDRFVAVGEEEILYIISNIFAKPQVFYYLVSDAKIFDIIYQLSPLLECDPTACPTPPLLECDSTVCLPSKS